MKTQLLQDFQESGSAPASPRRPAVWHGPAAKHAEAGAAVQRADPGPMQRAPETSARGKGVAIEAWAERAAQARPPRPTPPPPPSPPSPPIDEATVPDHEARQRPPPPDRHEIPDHIPPPRADAGTIPRPSAPDTEADWFAARLREETAAREAPAWSSMWKRRLVTWSIAGGLLAGLAAGGLWLYEENRVEDALVVVANTSPAGQPPAVRAFAAGVPAAAPAAAPVQPPVTTDLVKPIPEQAAPAVADTVDVTPPRRAPGEKITKKRTTAKPRREAAPEAPRVAAEPSPRQRREETLMQCRAHGYDARRCIERACTMTRYGLACKG
jgi:hypothetical protein